VSNRDAGNSDEYWSWMGERTGGQRGETCAHQEYKCSRWRPILAIRGREQAPHRSYSKDWHSAVDLVKGWGEGLNEHTTYLGGRGKHKDVPLSKSASEGGKQGERYHLFPSDYVLKFLGAGERGAGEHLSGATEEGWISSHLYVLPYSKEGSGKDDS